MFSHKHTIFNFYVHIKTHEVWWCARRLVSLRKTTTYTLCCIVSTSVFHIFSSFLHTHSLPLYACTHTHTHRQMSSTLKLNGWPDGESLSFSNKDLSLLSLHPSLPSSAFFSFCLFLASMCVCNCYCMDSKTQPYTQINTQTHGFNLHIFRHTCIHA